MKELVKLNKNLIEQLNICKNELLYQKEALKKMKVMGTLLATLLIKKIQDNKNDEVKMKEDSKDNKDRKIYKEKLAKFFYKYIEYRKIRMSQIFSKKNNSIINLKNSTFSNKSLSLAQSPLRSDAQLTIMEKATELGVRAVFPIITDNCALAESVLTKKHEKWQKIMYEASKQCERAKIPVCHKPQSIDNLLNSNKFNKILVMAERSTEISLKEYLDKNPVKKNERVLVIIGPEGGFSQKEFDYFKSKKLPLITLGDLILKAETAVILTLGNIIYEYKG